MTPRLSIVIPSHNRPDLLQSCLASIHRHAPESTEVIVVDDGSPEGVITRAAESFAATKVIRHETPRGFCVAVNRGVAAAQASIVELLNDDTEVQPGWAEPALAAFADIEVAAVSPLVLLARCADTIDSAGDGYHIGGVAYKRHHGKRLSQVELRAEDVFGANGTASFFRRDVFLAVGGMPEDFVAYFDDIDLSFRLHQAGFRVRFAPGSHVRHHVSSSYGRPGGDLLARQSCNEELVFWRNLPARQLLLALPLHAAVVAAKSLLRLREGNLLPFLRGRCAALSKLPAICRHRWNRRPAASLVSASEAG